MLYPDNERLVHFGDFARVVVSEPLTDLPGAWREVPAETALIIELACSRKSLRPFGVAAFMGDLRKQTACGFDAWAQPIDGAHAG
jgi:hypothetical protein